MIRYVFGLLAMLAVCCMGETMECKDFSSLWKKGTVGAERQKLLDAFQAVVDKTPKAVFDGFDDDPAQKTDNPVLKYYDMSLERLLRDIPAEKVQPGSVAIWYLYNMGFVVKTPDACFGVDIHHRNAVKLEPLLDFLLVTHNHNDHWSMPLLGAMGRAKKPIISNFHPNNYYTKAKSFTHEIKGIVIHCGEADHNSRLRKFTMPMEVVCPTGDTRFVLFTSGDCCDHSFLEKKSGAVDLYMVHPCCGMVAAEAAKRLAAKMTFIVHLQELGHEINVYRWPFTVGDDELAAFRSIGYGAYMPVWGEKFIWKNGVLSTGCDDAGQ